MREHPYFKPLPIRHPAHISELPALRTDAFLDLEREEIHRNLFNNGGADFDPAALRRQLMVNPILRNLYDRISNPVEGYALKKHTKHVQETFEEFFSHRFGTELAGGVSKALMRVLLAVHDMGKPDAIANNQKDQEHAYTWRLVEPLLLALGFSTRDRDIARALLCTNAIGPYLMSRRFHINCTPENRDRYAARIREEFGLDEIALADIFERYESCGCVTFGTNLERHMRQVTLRKIREAAAFAGLEISDYFELMRIYFMSDLGSYITALGGKSAFADTYFTVDRQARRINWSSEYNKLFRRLESGLGMKPATDKGRLQATTSTSRILQVSDKEILHQTIRGFPGRRILFVGCGADLNDIKRVFRARKNSQHELYIGIDPLLPEALSEADKKIEHQGLPASILAMRGKTSEVLTGLEEEIDVVYIIAPFGTSMYPLNLGMNPTLLQHDADTLYRVLNRGGYLDLVTENYDWAEEYAATLKFRFGESARQHLHFDDVLAPNSSYMQGRWEGIGALYRLLAFKR